MNAYELADELQELDAKLHLIVLFKSAEILRQQADRIAELEKQGKPVAWMFQGAFDISTYVSFEKPNPDIYPNPTPLYTASQTKPLSDEEIAEIWKKEWQGGNIGHIAYTYARAIEERHGIK